MVGLVRLKVEDIVIGVTLPWSIYDRNGTFLIKQDFVLKSESQVEHLLVHGAFGLKAEMGVVEAPEEVRPESVKPRDFSPFKSLEDVTNQLALTLTNSNNLEINFTDDIMALLKYNALFS